MSDVTRRALDAVRHRRAVSMAERALAEAGGELATDLGVSTVVGLDDVVVTVGAWLLPGTGRLELVGDGTVLRTIAIDTPIPADGPTDRTPMRWEIRVARTELGAGTHELEVRIHADGGVVQTHGEHVELPTAVALGAIDSPPDGAVIGGDVLRVGGWFRSGKGFDGIEVEVHDVDRDALHAEVRARLMSEHRRDIADAVEDVDAPLSGWIATLDLDGLGSSVVLTATAVADDGQRTVLGTRTLRHRRRTTAVPEREVDRLRVLRERSDRTFARRTVEPRDPGRPVRVLVAAHSLAIGGGQLYLHELMLRMRDVAPVEFVVLAGDDGVLRDELEALGIEVRIVGTPPGHGLRHEEWIRGVGAVALEDDVDAVLANTAAAYWGVDLAERLGVPSVWAVHESFPVSVFLDAVFGEQRDPYVRQLFDRAFAVADRVVFEAAATEEIYAGLTSGNTTVIDYGVPVPSVDVSDPAVRRAHRDAARERLGLDPAARMLVSVGSFEPRKAQGMLVTAFARVAGQHPHAQLALVGDSPSPYSTGVHEVVSRSGFGRSVRIVPVSEHIDDWYAAADLFVLGSDVESLPRSMLDAMAHGVPVVGTAVFGVPSLVEDGVNGFLFEPGSMGAFTEVVERALSLSEDELSRMSSAAFDTVRATRDSRGYAEAYTALFDQLTGRGEHDRATPRDRG